MLKLLIPILFMMVLNSSWSMTSLMLSFIIFMNLLFMSPSTLMFDVASQTLWNDNMSLSLIILSLWVSNLMILASMPIKLKSNQAPWFLNLILILMVILILAFTTNNMIMFYVLFEASLIPTMMIILGWGYQPERLQASAYLMMYTVTASIPLLLMLSYIFFSSNSMFMMTKYMNPLTITSSIMLLMALLVKMPMYIVHLWLPKAHVEAPVAGSMVLAAILLKLGAYGIMRITFVCSLLPKTMIFSLMSISLWGGMIASMMCLRQQDMKALIAYSSVSHMSLCIMGLLSFLIWGWEGSIMMMVAHGLSSSGLFFLANSLYESTNTRSVFLSKGIMSILPSMTTAWFFMSIANMGAPPSLNLLSEITLLSSITSMSLATLMFTLPSMFLAAAYSMILFTTTQHGQLNNFSTYSPQSLNRNMLISLAHIMPLFSIFLLSGVLASLCF